MKKFAISLEKVWNAVQNFFTFVCVTLNPKARKLALAHEAALKMALRDKINSLPTMSVKELDEFHIDDED